MTADVMIIVLLSGMLTGFFANKLVKGLGGIVGNIVVGFIGAALAGLLANAFDMHDWGMATSLIVSILGAAGLLMAFYKLNLSLGD